MRVSIGQAPKEQGVSRTTLRRWEVERTSNGQRCYDLTKLWGIVPRKAPCDRLMLAYGRVSCRDQKDDLRTQVGMHEFRRQVENETAGYGSEVVFAERWYPSSKTPRPCGHLEETWTLSQRSDRCNMCGLIIDFDINTARNRAQRNPERSRKIATTASSAGRAASDVLHPQTHQTPVESKQDPTDL